MLSLCPYENLAFEHQVKCEANEAASSPSPYSIDRGQSAKSQGHAHLIVPNAD